MTAHAIRLAQWQDADHLLGYYVVWDGKRLYQMCNSSPRGKAEIRRSFPDVEFHPVTLTQQGDWVEPDMEFLRFMFGYPEFYEMLVQHYAISPTHFKEGDPRLDFVKKVKALAESMM